MLVWLLDVLGNRVIQFSETETNYHLKSAAKKQTQVNLAAGLGSLTGRARGAGEKIYRGRYGW